MGDLNAVQESKELQEILQKIMADELEIWRARSRVYAICNHYTELFDGESYDVRLSDATFNGLYNGEISSTGPLQVVGTHHTNEFLWSWHNPSIPQKAWQAVKDFCGSEETLAPLTKQRKFACHKETAEKIAQWIAVRMGWNGAYEAPNQQAVSFLILKLTPGDTYDESSSNAIWCSFCGRSRAHVHQLFAAASTCAICNLCVKQFKNIMEDREAIGDLSTDPAPYMAPCLLCGEKIPRTFTKYGAVCYECMRMPVFDGVT